MPGIAIFCAAFLLAGSLAVWAILISRWNRGWPALPFRERPGAELGTGTVIASVVLWILSQFLAGLFYPPIAATLDSVKFATLSNVLTFVFVVAFLEAAWGIRSGASSFPDLGLSTHDLPQEIALGVSGFFASLLPVLAVLLLTYPLRSESTQHSFLQFLRRDSSFVAIVWLVIAVGIMAPLAEELLFRVVLQGSLQRRLPPEIAIGISSALFASVHNWPDLLALLPLAAILGYIYHQQNSYLAVVVLHGLFNLANLVLMLLSENGT